MKRSILICAFLLGSIPATAQPLGTPVRELGRSKYALPPGKIQVAALIGTNYYQGIAQTRPTAGGEFLVGLPHNLAIYGDGAYSANTGFDSPWASAALDFHSVGAGFQWSIPNRTRIVPYLRSGLGWIHIDAGARLGAWSLRHSGSRFTGNFGGGMKVHLAENFGLLVDLQVSSAPELLWMGRTSFGFFYQFK